MPNVLINRSIAVTDTIQNIDFWKVYADINGAGYTEISEETYDYQCPYVISGEYRIYTFAFSYDTTGLSAGDTFKLRFNPASYDADLTSFVFETGLYTVIEGGGAVLSRVKVKVAVGCFV